MISSLFLFASLVAGAALEKRQANNTIVGVVETGINTECKTCPYSLCPNLVAYDNGITDPFNLTCWTEGTDINGDTTWLGTTDGCYVTQWDLKEYPGDYTTDLPYCGATPETITTGTSRTVYYTECNLTPTFVDNADHVKLHPPEVDLTLTCFTDYLNPGSSVLGNDVWYKTVSNCYVPEAQIEYVDPGLDSCGPVPFLEKKMREPDPVEVPEEPTFAPATETRSLNNEKRWLYTTQIGQDSANCTSAPDATSDIERTYDFGGYLIVQCATFNTNPDEGRVIYLLTTDFCYVDDNLADPMLIDDTLRSQRYPNCVDFVDLET